MNFNSNASLRALKRRERQRNPFRVYQLIIRDYPEKLLSPTRDCGDAGARQSGHSGFLVVHPATQRQQKTWPQGVAAGNRRSERQRAHFVLTNGDVDDDDDDDGLPLPSSIG